MVSICYSQIHACLFVLPDPENIGIAFEIVLLLCIEHEINFVSYLFPVNGHHLWFPTNPYVGQYSPCCRTPKHGWGRRNFIAIMYRSWHTCNYVFSRYLGFLTSGFIWQCFWWCRWKVYSQKHRSRHRNYVSMASNSWVTREWQLCHPLLFTLLNLVRCPWVNMHVRCK